MEEAIITTFSADEGEESDHEAIVCWDQLGRRGRMGGWCSKLSQCLFVKCVVVIGEFERPVWTCQVDLRKDGAVFSIIPQA